MNKKTMNNEAVIQMEPVLLPPRAAAAALGIKESTLRGYRRAGCPVVFTGSTTTGGGSRPRYNPRAVAAWMAERSAAAVQAAMDADRKELQQ